MANSLLGFIGLVFNQMMFSGTIMDGKFDRIIGPAGRKGYDYNWTDLQHSLVSKAIENTRSSLPYLDIMQNLREESEVKCGESKVSVLNL